MKRFALLLTSITLTFVLSACFLFDTGGGGEVILPDFPPTPDDGVNSWEHDNEPFEFTWFVNSSWFAWNTNGTDVVSRILEEKTGARIRFITPVTDDGQLLSTMIAGNQLPDVVSIQAWYPQVSQLANQGYIYPLDDLIDRWAPTFRNRIQQDVWDWFQMGDGKTYGTPNFAYSSDYLEPGEQLMPNGAILVREDWYYEVEDAGIDMTTPSGFLEGVQYIRNKYSQAIGVQFDTFDSEGNRSLQWLSQYFAVPFEQEDGSYQLPWTHPRYLDMLEFVNTLYREGHLRDANFSANRTQVRTTLASGNVFVSMVTPQDYNQAFLSNYTNGIRYIPLVLRHEDGAAPVLQDIRGMGFLLSMITTNAERPDKIIRVFEYLYSEEGQRLVAFGEEGTTWEWTDETQTQVRWTEQYLNDLETGNVGQYGLFQMNLLMNLAYINRIMPSEGRTSQDIYVDNLKRPLTPFSYDYTPNFLLPDTARDDYFNFTTQSNRVTSTWSEWLPDIIRANSTAQALEYYESAIAAMNSRGLPTVVAFREDAYQRAKDAIGVEMGWPPHQPGYQIPSTGPNGDFSYWRYALYERQD